MNYQLKSVNNTYDVVNFKRRDGLYNVYVQRTSNLTDVFKGEATYCIGCDKPKMDIDLNQIIDLKYEI